MITFFSRLAERIQKSNSLLCVGLDPHPQDLSTYSAKGALDFCFRIIENTSEKAAAFKPNAAFFEALGPDGFSALADVIASVPDGIPVILDAKRGDIASTAEAYARAVFDVLGADAVTLNPYLGFDSIEPFLSDPKRGVFLLCKTSNPGASDIQDLDVLTSLGESLSTPLYIHLAQLATNWNKQGNLGLVVGATQPGSLAKIRKAAPDLWILAPGVGAQRGDLTETIRVGLRSDGLGMIIPISRGISRAENQHQAAINFRDAINQARSSVIGHKFDKPDTSLKRELAQIADGLLETGCVKFGNFTLKSGISSPIYIDLRRLVGFPRLLVEISRSFCKVLNNLDFDHLAALPYAAMPITSAIALQSNWSMVYPRKEVKTYGTKAQVEGAFTSGDVAVVIDDLISTGGSKFAGVEQLKSVGLTVNDIVVLIDRSTSGKAELARRGITLHALMSLSQMLDYYQNKKAVSVDVINQVRTFLANQKDE
jgi:uridine monophosphate synthetase